MNLSHIEMGINEFQFILLEEMHFNYMLFSVPEAMIKKITYQVLNAVEFCHRHNVRK